MTNSFDRRLFATCRWLLSLLILLGSGCAATTAKSLLAPDKASTSIYVVSHGWHAGVVLRRADIPHGVWPESGDFPAAEFLEVGWGDLDFYRAQDPGYWMMLKAATLSDASVLHVVGFAKPVADYFSYNKIVAIPLPQPQISALARFIDQTHRRNGAVRASALGPGLYGDSRFYPAHGSFHVFNNCNTWTSRALAAAGLPLPSWRIILAEGVMEHAAKFGTVLH